MAQDIDARTQDALTWLKRHGTKRNRDGLARYGIVAPKAFGVSMRDVQALAKRLGPDHALALSLWDTGWYEAQLLTAFVAEPGGGNPPPMGPTGPEKGKRAEGGTQGVKQIEN